MILLEGGQGFRSQFAFFSPPPANSLPRQFARYVDFVTGLYMPTLFC